MRPWPKFIVAQRTSRLHQLLQLRCKRRGSIPLSCTYVSPADPRVIYSHLHYRTISQSTKLTEVSMLKWGNANLEAHAPV